MTLTVRPSPRISISTCEGLFEKLKWDLEQLELGWDEYRTFNFVVTAYHLYEDWIKRGGTAIQQERKAALPERAKILFKVLRDITNASKHWELHGGSQARQIVDHVSAPEIRDWYAYLIAGPVIYVSVGGGLPSMPELASVTIGCFEWIINSQSSSFPDELARSLDVIFAPLNGNPSPNPAE